MKFYVRAFKSGHLLQKYTTFKKRIYLPMLNAYSKYVKQVEIALGMQYLGHQSF